MEFVCDLEFMICDFRVIALRAMRLGRSESLPGDCLSKTQLPANSQEYV